MLFLRGGGDGQEQNAEPQFLAEKSQPGTQLRMSNEESSQILSSASNASNTIIADENKTGKSGLDALDQLLNNPSVLEFADALFSDPKMQASKEY